MRKVKPAMSTRPREYLTITHEAVAKFFPCWHRLILFKKTFPYAEFGSRGIPITVENVVRMLKAGLPPRWVLNRFCNSYENNFANLLGTQAYLRETTDIPFCAVRKRAVIFVRIVHEHANDKVRRITAPSKLTTLKGAPLMKVAA